MKNYRLRLWLPQNERLSRAKRAAARMPCRMSQGHGKTTDSQKRQRVPSLSEMGAALEQAEVEVTGLKADLAKARAASAKWLQLQAENGKQLQRQRKLKRKLKKQTLQRQKQKLLKLRLQKHL